MSKFEFPGLTIKPEPIAHERSRTSAFTLRLYSSSLGEYVTVATYDAEVGHLTGGTRLTADQVRELADYLRDWLEEASPL